MITNAKYVHFDMLTEIVCLHTSGNIKRYQLATPCVAKVSEMCFPSSSMGRKFIQLR